MKEKLDFRSKLILALAVVTFAGYAFVLFYYIYNFIR